MRRDEELRGEAVRILQDLAYEGDQIAKSMLKDLGNQSQKTPSELAAALKRESGTQRVQSDRARNGRSPSEMSIAERLGRAMILLWQAERADDPIQRCSGCAEALELLNFPEANIDDDLLAAFVETRGLVLLASGDARMALTYFQDQAHHYGRGGWIGVQLGGERARIVLGLPSDADDTVEAPSSRTARFALSVARVIHALSSAPQESAIRHLLKTLYSKAADFASHAQSNAGGKLVIENGEGMLGTFLQTRWFRPAGIQSADDLDQPSRLSTVVNFIKNTRIDTFDVLSNSTLMIAG